MISAGAASEQGWRRDVNEDRFLLDSKHLVFAVLDGCGQDGLFADMILASLRSTIARHDDDASLSVVDLEAAIRSAEVQIHELLQITPRLKGCGAAILVALLSESRLVALHAGDCRLYRL